MLQPSLVMQKYVKNKFSVLHMYVLLLHQNEYVAILLHVYYNICMFIHTLYYTIILYAEMSQYFLPLDLTHPISEGYQTWNSCTVVHILLPELLHKCRFFDEYHCYHNVQRHSKC